MGYPVHSYGSNQVLNAWRHTQQNKQMRDDAITQAILQGVSTGAVEAPEGSPVYKGLSKRFGPQFVKGVSEKGAQIRQNQQLEYAVNNFNLGMKYFETASKLQSQMGPEKANPMIKQWTPKVNEHFKQAGLDINVSEMFTAQRNKELIREGIATKLQKATEVAVSNPTWANYNQAVTAYNAVYSQKGLMDGTTKDAMDLGMKTLDTVKDRLMKQEEEAKQRRVEGLRQKNRIQLANQKQKEEKEEKNLKRIAYQAWVKQPGNEGKSPLHFEPVWRKSGIDAKLMALKENQGGVISDEQVWKIIANDPYGISAPAPGIAKTSRPQKGGKLTPEQAKDILDEAGGDKEKARELAKARNFRF